MHILTGQYFPRKVEKRRKGKKWKPALDRHEITTGEGLKKEVLDTGNPSHTHTKSHTKGYL